MRKTVKDWIKLSEESLQVEKHDLQSNKKSMDYMYTVKIEGQVEWQEKTEAELNMLDLQGVYYEVKHDLQYFQKQVESERPVSTGDIMDPRFSMTEYYKLVNQEAWNRYRKQ